MSVRDVSEKIADYVSVCLRPLGWLLVYAFRGLQKMFRAEVEFGEDRKKKERYFVSDVEDVAWYVIEFVLRMAIWIVVGSVLLVLNSILMCVQLVVGLIFFYHAQPVWIINPWNRK